MRRSIAIVVLVLLSSSVFSQNEVMVSQYMFNGLFINPAYAGSHEYWESTALHRSQWVSLDGAPNSQLLEIDGPLNNGNIGLGGIIMHDKIGDTEQFEFSANAAYHLTINENEDAKSFSKLAFGIRAGLTHFTERLNETFIVDQNDNVFMNGANGELIPKFGIGAYYYTKTAYVGISVPTIFAADDNLQVNIGNTETDDVFFENHIFLNAGKYFQLNENLGLKPNVLVKYHQAAPVEVDINCNALVNEILWFGVSYRTNDAVIGLVEVMPTPKLRIGYAYDFTLTDIANYSSGSHEIMLGYALGADVIKMKSPRLF